MRSAHDPQAVRRLLERSLQPAAGHRFAVDDVRVATIRRRDGTRWSVQYDAELRDIESGATRRQIVSGVVFGGGRTRRVWQSLRPPADADPTALPPFAYVPDLDMLLQVFPFDQRLPALAALVAGPPSELVPSIEAAFGAGRWRIERRRAEAVRYRVGQRATLRLHVAPSWTGLGPMRPERSRPSPRRSPRGWAPTGRGRRTTTSNRTTSCSPKIGSA